MKARVFAVVALVATLGLTACSQSSSARSGSGVYTDDIGRTVRIQAVPERIVSLSPSNTEIVYALGLQDKLVGVTSYDDYPPDAKTKPVVSDYSTTDLEKIVNAKPDLVLADSIQKNDAIPAMEKLGINVFTMAPNNIDALFNDLEVLGRITGETKEANGLVSSLKSNIDAIRKKTAGLNDSQRPRVLFVTWHDPIWTAGSNTMIQDLIGLAGGTNIASDLQGYTTITMETAVERNPQVIVVMGTMGVQNVSMDFIKSSDQFKATDAVKNGQVYEIDADIFGRTSPRIVDGLETLAKILHPDLFK